VAEGGSHPVLRTAPVTLSLSKGANASACERILDPPAS
jgi:hypothetical protein